MACSDPTPQLSPRNLGNLESDSCKNVGCPTKLTKYHAFRECDLQKHKICRGCYAKLHEKCEPQSPKCPLCESCLRPVEPSLNDDLVFIYVDNSNIWIEGKKLAAKQQKLRCVEDPRMRLDIGKVADVVANGRHVAWRVLYGSEPPPLDTVWNKISELGWNVITKKRSTFQNTEKQVDQQLVADIVALVCDKDIVKGKIAIISGDADVIPAIRKGEGCWSFEIWMWESAISTELKDLAVKEPELLKIYILDSHLQSISFTNFTIDASETLSKLKSQSVVIENYRYDFVPNEEWQKGLTAKLGWPFQACTIGPKTLESSLGFKDLLLVFPKVKSKDDEDFINHFEKVFERLQQEYQGKVVNLPGYFQKNGSDAKICITSNKLETLKDFDEQLSFNSTFSQNEAEERGQDRDQERQVEEKRQPDEDDDSSFKLVRSKHIKKKHQMYSEQCEQHSYCKKRSLCKFAHTDAEKEFFRNPDKRTLCRFYIKKSCQRGSRCRFAHSGKDSYCCKCNQWGHLQDKCSLN